MASRKILQHLLASAGQEQRDRQTPELGEHYFEVDERRPIDWLRWLRDNVAGSLRFDDGQPPKPNENPPPKDWRPFFEQHLPRFPLESLPDHPDGDLPPHLALWVVACLLYEYPREVMNRFTDRHLDHFYRDLLGFRARPAKPEAVHLLLELKKGAARLALPAGSAFLAGKGPDGRERVFRSTQPALVGHAKVESLRAFFLDPASGHLHYAAVANSADGWPAFGHAALPVGEVGFAVASPILRLREGQRRVGLTLQLDNPKITAPNLAMSLHAFVTGAKAWLGPFELNAVSKTTSPGNISLELLLAAADPPVAPYRPDIHGYAFQSDPEAPILRLVRRPTLVGQSELLAKGQSGGLGGLLTELGQTTLLGLELEVEVQGMTGFELQNDLGRLDPTKSHLPFGPLPTTGSRWVIRDPEVFGKRLEEVRVHGEWQDKPADLATWYKNYQDGAKAQEASFTAQMRARDGASREAARSAVPLFGKNQVATWSLAFPSAEPPQNAAQRLQAGFLELALERDFLHAAFRREAVVKLIEFAHGPDATKAAALLNEPYTPTLRSLRLDYRARAKVDLEQGQNGGAFFHLLPGQVARQEHRALRSRLPGVATQITLFPRFARGELWIGLTGVAPGERVDLLFQVVEGSAAANAGAGTPSSRLWEFAAAAEGHWSLLPPEALPRDSTRQLRRSGILGCQLPAHASADPQGLFWLRVATTDHAESVAVAATLQLRQVAANAIEALGEPGAAAATALPAGSISRLQHGVVGLKAIRQPFDGFGAAAAEDAAALRRRAAERLRHRDRAQSAWDYERLVLAAFPSLHRVKCIPHARPGSWSSPGHVLLVVVPDLRQRVVVDPLQPKVDAETQNAIQEFLRARCGRWVEIAVQNPSYQEVQVDCGVRFHLGFEPNHHLRELDQALARFLSPWAFDASRPIQFGGKVFRSVLLDFVEELPYVDYVRDFRLLAQPSGAAFPHDVHEASADQPDAILVSAAHHAIREVAP